MYFQIRKHFKHTSLSNKWLVCFGLFLSLLYFSSCNSKQDKCEKEVYLIPEGYRGLFFVFFDVKDGQETTYENEARLYKIPSSGILKTQFPKNGGCMSDNRIQFFHIDSTGNRKELTYFLNIEDNDSIPENKDYVMLTLFNNKKEDNSFAVHIIGQKHEFNELTNKVRQLNIDSISGLF